MANPLADEDIEDLGAEHSGVDCDGLSGLQPELKLVFLRCLLKEGNQGLAIVVRFCNPMAAAEIQVSELRMSQERSKVSLHRLHRGEKVCRRLLAEGMKVKGGETRQVQILSELVRRHPEAAARRAGIIESRLSCRVEWIDAEPKVEVSGKRPRMGEAARAMSLPLRKGVEVEMGGDFEELGEILV